MKVTCQSCGARYGIADEKIRGRRAKVRCKSCSTVFVVDGTALDPDAEAARASQAPSLSLPPPEPASEQPTSAQASEPDPPADPDVWSVSVTDADERTLRTAELISGLQSGEFGDDPYVWQEGMEDWASPMNVPRLSTLLTATNLTDENAPETPKTPAASEEATAAPLPEDGAPTAAHSPDGAPHEELPEPVDPALETNADYVPVASGGTPPPFDTNVDYAPVAPPQVDASAAGSPEPTPEPESAPRPDLFAGVDRAGSEEDVIASVPPPPPPTPTTKTGERNENSVLFSLDALRGGGPAKPSAPEPPAATPNLTELVAPAHGSMEQDGDLAALAAPISAPPAPAAAPAQPEPKKSKLGLFLGAAAVLGAVGIGFALGSDKNEPTHAPVAKVEKPAPKQATAPPEKPAEKVASPTPAASPETKPTPNPNESPKDPQAEKPTDAKAALAEADATEAKTPPAKPKAPPKAAKKKAPKKTAKRTTTKKKKKTAAKPKPPTKRKKTAPPFDMKAARSALSRAAKSAKRCQRSGGSAGKVKVSVTFSNSGRTTSAKVIDGAVRGTLVGGCVAQAFRKAKVPAFTGPKKTIPVSFRLN